jgi:hypothetical protein
LEGPAPPVMPRPRRPKGRGASFESGGRPAMERRSPKYKEEHNEHPRTGYRTAEPSDSPPWASRYAQFYACRPNPPIKGARRARRLTPSRPSGGHALRPEERRLRRRASGPRFKGSRGRKSPVKHLTVRSARSLMVAAASRRQGSHLPMGFGSRSRRAFPLDRASVGRCAKRAPCGANAPREVELIRLHYYAL